MHDYGAVLPRDPVHFVVEAELGLEFGFWGLLAAGAKLPAVQAFNARGPRRIPPQSDPLVRAHVDEPITAEGLVAAFSGLSGTEPEPDLDPDRAHRIRARIAELNVRWQAVAPGGILRLRWPDAGARFSGGEGAAG
ncbi:MAG: hypothetical protein ACRDV9_12570 [Acidimicrobiia bacterium]